MSLAAEVLGLAAGSGVVVVRLEGDLLVADEEIVPSAGAVTPSEQSSIDEQRDRMRTSRAVESEQAAAGDEPPWGAFDVTGVPSTSSGGGSWRWRITSIRQRASATSSKGDQSHGGAERPIGSPQWDQTATEISDWPTAGTARHILRVVWGVPEEPVVPALYDG